MKNLALIELDLTDESIAALKTLRSVGPVRCDRCRHWGDEDEARPRREFKETPHRQCQQVRHLYNYDGDNQYGPPPLDRVPAAYAMDASGYKAEVWTAPGFGCALFEAKEGT